MAEDTEPTEVSPPVAEPKENLQPIIEKPTKPHKEGTKWRRLWHAYLDKKKWTIPVTIVAVIGLVLAIPFSRYPVLGLFLKKSFSVQVVDSQTARPVTNADLLLGSVSAKTDNQGKATLKSKVGHHTLKVTKKYYQDSTQKVLVGLGKQKQAQSVKLTATGRQVPVKVTNKINGKPVAGITIKVSDTEAQTDANGQATIVVPVTSTTLDATLSGSGFNSLTVKIHVTDQDESANHFAVVPSGKIYFLSKSSGKIDIVKTNLDGTARQTVLAGTGKEDENNTVLLASRDWKYLALLAHRDGELAKLYSIDTSSDKLTTMDEGNANFDLIGWQNNFFVYLVNRTNVPAWQPKATSLKSYNAQTGKLLTLDNNDAAGTSNADAVYEAFNSANTYQLGGKLIYTKVWYKYPGYLNVAGRQNTLNSINPDGSNHKVISSYDGATGKYFGSLYQYEADELLVQVSGNSDVTFFTLDSSGVYKASPTTKPEDTNKTYPTYLLSPSGKQTFWFEERDGKNTLFVGDSAGKNTQTIGSLSVYKPYGWYTDNYLLVSKNSSELFVMANGPITQNQPVKISDYHKPAQNFNGYGGGYGGL